MTTASSRVEIERADFYGNGQFEVYDWLQKHDPVHYYEPLDVFVVSRYEDVRYISRTTDIFSNTGALTLNMIRLARSGAGNSLEQFFDKSGEMVITLDPPRHRQLKHTLTPAFNPRAVRTLEPAINEMCKRLVDDIVPGVAMDVVPAIAAKLPVYVAARVLGLGDVNLDDVGRWINALESLTRVETFEELLVAAGDFGTMNDVMVAALAEKRDQPGDDLISLLLATELDGQPLTDAQMLSHLSTLISNGGTTRALIGSMLGLLAEHPDQLELLVAKPELLGGAIEESLRFAPPARGFARVVLRDVELGGERIRAGQHVYMLYSAANRDPDVFPDPQRFDITRHGDRMHVSFGYGAHTCLGAALVRLEITQLFTELLGRYSALEVVEEPVPQEHVQLNAWQHLTMKFHVRP
jgi:cytochrome P450